MDVDGDVISTTASCSGASSAPQGLVEAPASPTGGGLTDSIWVAENAADSICEIIDPTTAPTAQTAIDVSGEGEEPYDIATSNDFLWVTLNASGLIATYDIPNEVLSSEDATDPASGTSEPKRIITGPAGNLWYTFGAINSIARMEEATPTNIESVSGINNPTDSILLGPSDLEIWFTEPSADIFGKITLDGGPPFSATEYTLTTTSSSPYGLAFGADVGQNIWIAENGIGRIARSMRSTPTSITEFPIIKPFALAKSAGQVWFTASNANVIGAINPNTSVITEYIVDVPVPSLVAGDQELGLRGITTDANGNLWFAEMNVDKIGAMTNAGAVKDQYDSTATSPLAITLGPDAALWFTATSSIGRINTSGTVTLTTATTGSPADITSGPLGKIWFTETLAGLVGNIATTGGTVSEFSVKGSGNPAGITRGPSGNLWITDESNSGIFVFSPIPNANNTLNSTMFTTPTTPSGPTAITLGPSNNLWFTEIIASKIGKLTLN